MDHVAIMKKSWNLIPKILSQEKTIESRWYKSRIAPWDRIQPGDIVFFKNSAEPVTAKAEVEKVLQFDHYTDKELQNIITTYGGNPGICFHSSPQEVITWARPKQYCILIFLKNAEHITPFHINKTGFGNACAWLTINSITNIQQRL